MAFLTTLFGASATTRRPPTLAGGFEWLGGMVLVASFVGLGYNLAQAAG